MDNNAENCNEITSLDDQLNCLRKQLLEWQSQYQVADSKIKERQAQIEALGSFIGDFEKIVSAYKDKQPELEKKQAMYKDSCDKLTKCLESVLGEECFKKVCDTADAVNKEIEKLTNDIRDDEAQLVTANTKKEEAKHKLDEVKNSFDLLKDPIKSIEARFKLLDPLLKEIELEKNNNPTIAYYLLKCKRKYCWQVENAEPEVYKPDIFKDKLQEAWKTYRSADSAFNEADSQVKSLEKKLEIKKAQLATDTKDLETKIRRKLTELANSSACSNKNKESSDYHCN